MNDDVLTCPFCGGPAEAKQEESIGSRTEPATYRVECVACDAQGPSARSEETAWTLWYVREKRQQTTRMETTMNEITRDEFLARFKAEMLKHATTFADGGSVADYADEVGPTYWEDAEQREEGPEACARADVDCWGG